MEAGLREFQIEAMACAQRERRNVKSMAYSRKLSEFRVVGAKGSQSGEGEPGSDDSWPRKPQ